MAAPLSEAQLASEVAGRLSVDHGHIIMSDWHRRVAPGAVDPDDHSERRRALEENLAAVAAAHALVALTHRGKPRATFGEIAYALARGTKVVWVHGHDGAGRNIFDAHPLVRMIAIPDVRVDAGTVVVVDVVTAIAEALDPIGFGRAANVGGSR